MNFLADHWLSILGAVLVSWSLFMLGREYEFDHPREGVRFTPDESWDEPGIEVRRGIYDHRNEDI